MITNDRTPLKFCADYYYYATAGGAKIWVRPFCHRTHLILLNICRSGRNI